MDRKRTRNFVATLIIIIFYITIILIILFPNYRETGKYPLAITILIIFMVITIITAIFRLEYNEEKLKKSKERLSKEIENLSEEIKNMTPEIFYENFKERWDMNEDPIIVDFKNHLDILVSNEKIKEIYKEKSLFWIITKLEL
jgi:predicted ABC-type exoprotein transport system permease subunit